MNRLHERPETRNDSGFALIEMIVTTVMIGLVAVVLAAGITVIFRSEQGAVRITAESHDTQQGVNYFPLDIQAGPTDMAAYDQSATASGCDNTGDNVLDFVKGTHRVSYRLSITGTSARLDRYTCENSGTPAAPIWSNVVPVNIADTLDASVVPAASMNLQPAIDGTLQFAELTLAQQDGNAQIVASPRAEPRDSPGDCQTDNPLEAAHGYGVFVEGDVLLVDGTVTGWLALGGTLGWREDITIASGNMSGVSPAYGLYANDIDWTGDVALPPKQLTIASKQTAAIGTAFGQTDRYVHRDPLAPPYPLDPTNLEDYIYFSENPIPTAVTAAGINIDDEFDELRDCSAQLARALDLCATSGCAQEVDVTLTGTTVNLCPDDPTAQILNLPESYLGPGYSFTSTGPGCTGWSQQRPLIINVIDDGDGTVTIDTAAVDWENVIGDLKNILFNFPNSSDVIVNSEFYGELLAPFAHVQTHDDVQGGVVASQWTHHAGTITSHLDIFDNEIDWP